MSHQAGPHKVEGGIDKGGLKLLCRALVDMKFVGSSRVNLHSDLSLQTAISFVSHFSKLAIMARRKTVFALSWLRHGMVFAYLPCLSLPTHSRATRAWRFVSPKMRFFNALE